MIRLLNVYTLHFEEFHEADAPPYAIASHRWQNNETTFKDVLKSRNRGSAGFKKVEGFCDLIKSWEYEGSLGGIDWFWIDTCCIDTKSSAELSEAINSMYEWYANADICVAYLFDVQVHQETQALKSSNWFTRGWTLQELIAPPIVLFTDCHWRPIGHKKGSQSHIIQLASRNLGSEINEIISLRTGISEEVLLDHTKLDEINYEVRLSWMNGRYTTRIEDEAYCLLGILGINMPLIYGERQQATLRLLIEVLRKSLTKTQSSERQTGSEETAFNSAARNPQEMSSEYHYSVKSLQDRIILLEVEQNNSRLRQSFERQNRRSVRLFSSMLEQYKELEYQIQIENLAMEKAKAFWNPLEEYGLTSTVITEEGEQKGPNILKFIN